MLGSADFELFIAEYVFHDYRSHVFSEGDVFEERMVWNTFSASVYETSDSITKLPVDWGIQKEDFESLDSISYGVRNLSGSKFYYMSWGTPNSRVRRDFFVHKEGAIDTILYNGFGCSTGIHLVPLNNEDAALGNEENPLLKNPYSYEHFNLDSDSFPTIFSSFYGDSVGIRFRVPTYSLPWSKYEPQMIESETFVISTDKVIENWETRRNSTQSVR